MLKRYNFKTSIIVDTTVKGVFFALQYVLEILYQYNNGSSTYLCKFDLLSDSHKQNADFFYYEYAYNEYSYHVNN